MRFLSYERKVSYQTASPASGESEPTQARTTPAGVSLRALIREAECTELPVARSSHAVKGSTRPRMRFSATVPVCYCSLLCFEPISGRSHRGTCTGCTVSRTTATKSLLKVVRSLLCLSLAEDSWRVFLALYFLR